MLTCDLDLPQIECLMLEEVVSSLRHMHPLTSDTLTFVAEHIRSAGVHSPCNTVQYQSIPLSFVYGAEQSLNIFIEVRGCVFVVRKLNAHANKGNRQ